MTDFGGCTTNSTYDSCWFGVYIDTANVATKVVFCDSRSHHGHNVEHSPHLPLDSCMAGETSVPYVEEWWCVTSIHATDSHVLDSMWPLDVASMDEVTPDCIGHHVSVWLDW